MADNDAHRRNSLQPITQPQLPPGSVEVLSEEDLPDKTFIDKALSWRRATQGAVVLDPRGSRNCLGFNPLYTPAEDQTGEGEASGASR